MTKRSGSDWWKFHHDDFWDSEFVMEAADSAALAYVFLLGMQSKHGGLPGKDSAVLLMLGRRWGPKQARAIWETLGPRFPLCEDGKRRDARQHRDVLATDRQRELSRKRKERERAKKRNGEALEHNVTRDSSVTSAPCHADSLLSSPLSSSGSVSSSSLSEKKKTDSTGKLREAEPAVPAEIDTPEIRAALEAFQASRKEQGHKRLGRRGILGLYGKLASWGRAAALLALQESISNGWQGVFYPKSLRPGGEARFAAERSQQNIQTASRLLAERREHLRSLGIEDTDDESPRADRPRNGDPTARRLLPSTSHEHGNGRAVPALHGAVPAAGVDPGGGLVPGQLGPGWYPTDRDA